MTELSEIEIPAGCERIVLCGGPYNNFGAVESFLAETAPVDHRFCLGDLGGFGPHPGRTIELLRSSNVVCIQGNYDHAVGHGEGDCGCGYLDPRDREYAQISYDYTYRNTNESQRAWLRSLPPQLILRWRDRRILLCHGSPTEVNEFVWESETPDAKIAAWLRERRVDGICVTHSGLPWLRHVDAGFWLNVGVLGRPAHEGKRHVYYASIDFAKGASVPSPRLHALDYDPAPVIAAMRAEKLPEKFAEALERGVWTTCYNILPPGELDVRVRI